MNNIVYSNMYTAIVGRVPTPTGFVSTRLMKAHPYGYCVSAKDHLDKQLDENTGSLREHVSNYDLMR